VGSPFETTLQTYFDWFSRREIVLDGNIRNADVDLQQQLSHGVHQVVVVVVVVVGAGYRLTKTTLTAPPPCLWSRAAVPIIC